MSLAHPLSFPDAFMNPFPPRMEESSGAYCAEGRMQVDQAATTLTMLALGSSSSSSLSTYHPAEDRAARPTYLPSAFSNDLEGGSGSTINTHHNLPSIAELGLPRLPLMLPERRSSVASVASSVSSTSSSGCSTASSSAATVTSDSALSRSSSVSALSSLLSPQPPPSSPPAQPSSPAWNPSSVNRTLLPHPQPRHHHRPGGQGQGARRRGGGPRKPGAATNRNNQKYPDPHVDFVLYGRCTRNLPWAPLTAEYEQWQRRVAASGGGRLPSRTPSGLQARYYRQRLVVPVVDADGAITFDAAGKQLFREQKVRDDKCIDIKVDLIQMFPERVVHYAYDFVTPHEMERAKRLTALRNFQRRQRGLPEWEPEANQQRRRSRNSSGRDTLSLL